MKGPTCESCQFYEVRKPNIDGRCRRYPPAWSHMHGISNENFAASFPVVLRIDWCGEFQLRHTAAKDEA